MRTTSQSQAAARSLAVEAEDFDGLREAFYVRLQGERLFLIALCGGLLLAEGDPTAIVRDLASRAHRIQGGAAIFEFREIAEAANALEQAAKAALLSQPAAVPPADCANVDATLVALLGVLEAADERWHPAAEAGARS